MRLSLQLPWLLVVTPCIWSCTNLFESTLVTEAYTTPSRNSRRAFLSQSVTAASIAISSPLAAQAATPTILNTENGVKYATLREPKEKGFPQQGDIVAIEYTGYLTSGQIFDATHAEGKKNALMFEVGGNAVVPGISEMVSNMQVGQKVQAIVPAKLAFGDKGLCLEDGQCLIKPGETLVYDIFLKRSAIPPP